MDEDDAGWSSGISGGAGYLLGRMAADSDRRMADFRRRVFTREPPQRPTYDAAEVHEVIDGWKASVRSKEATIAQLRSQNGAVASERDGLLARVAELEKQAAEREGRIGLLETAMRGMDSSLDHAVGQLGDKELALLRASQQVEDLQAENERLRQAGK